MASKKRRGSEIMTPRSPVRRSLRRTVVDVPPDRRGGGESSRSTVRLGRVAGGRGGRGRERGRSSHGEAAEESESDSAGDVPEPIDPLGRPRRPLIRRMVGDIFSEEEEAPSRSRSRSRRRWPSLGVRSERVNEAPSETVGRDIRMDELTILRQESVSLHTEIASLRKMGLRQPLLSPGESRIKTLVLDLFGLFVSICRTHSDREVAMDMGYTVHRLSHPQISAPIYYVVRGDLTLVLDTLVSVAEVIIWTSRSREHTQLILEDMEDERLIPEGLTERLTIWGIDECDRVWPSRLERGKLTPMKDFRRFYDYRVCTRDVLLVDVEVAHNSPNHPFSAVHPWPFGVGLGTSLADHHAYVMDRLVPWLTEWSVDSSPTPDFVQSQRTRIGGADPIEGLRRFWGQPSEADRSIIWSSVSCAEGLVLAGLWPAVFGDVRPGDRPSADLVESVVGEPSLGPISADVLVDSGAVGSVGAVADPLVQPLVVSGAEGSVGAIADPLPEPVVVSGAEGSVGAVAHPLPEPVVVSGSEGLVGAVANPLLEPVVVSGAEGSVGAVADPLPEPVVDTGAEGSVGPVADPLPEPVVDTGAEGSVGPIPDLSALLIAHTVVELDAEGSAAPPSDE
ncbi:hypothetical protein R1sor_009993 [Riccia sorocarpa]|uniref:FCP1 homology domain-containing protein n=1 Tax=Riccia sorocarpa TaxID=122646 RepID=A0ABD3HZF5_9MARC